MGTLREALLTWFVVSSLVTCGTSIASSWDFVCYEDVADCYPILMTHYIKAQQNAKEAEKELSELRAAGAEAAKRLRVLEADMAHARRLLQYEDSRCDRVVAELKEAQVKKEAQLKHQLCVESEEYKTLINRGRNLTTENMNLIKKKNTCELQLEVETSNSKIIINKLQVKITDLSVTYKQCEQEKQNSIKNNELLEKSNFDCALDKKKSLTEFQLQLNSCENEKQNIISNNNRLRLLNSACENDKTNAIKAADAIKLEINEGILKLKDLKKVLDRMFNAARVFEDKKKYDEALKIFNLILDADILMYGAEHVESINTMISIGNVLAGAKRYDEASNIESIALEMSRRTLGKHHKYTLLLLNNLAFTRKYQGNEIEALRLFKELIKVPKDVLIKNLRSGVYEQTLKDIAALEGL